MTHSIMRRAGLGTLLALLVGCGAAPSAPPLRLDVLHHVYLRGAQSQGRPIALTIDGLGPCTGKILDALAGTTEEPRRYPATFFVDPEEWSDLHADEKTRPVLKRLAQSGHAVALGPRQVPASWQASPEEMRKGLSAMASTLDGWTRAVGLTPLRAWRPRNVVDLKVIGRTADATRPVVLWSLHAERTDDGASIAERLAPRLAPNAIVALPGGGRGCPTATALDALAPALTASTLTPVTLDALLAPQLARHTPARLVRYRGLGRPDRCALPGLATMDPDEKRTRWGLVLSQDGDAMRVLPVGADRSTAAVLNDPAIRQAARDRAGWAARPGCLRRIGAGQLESPVTAQTDRRRINWWSRTARGLERRDPRFVEPPSRAVMLPTRADLVRIEARQRLPWGLRGVVADALDRLGLEAPLLLEAGAGAAVVFARPVPLDADAQTIRAAIGGVVQIVEVTLGEYLFLAQRDARAVPVLQTAARASDGFVRAGPYLVLPQDGLPDLRHVGPDGRAPLDDAVALARAVLRAGQALQPGDVIAAGVPPVQGPPAAAAPPGLFSRRARLRHALARSILEGLRQPTYLRPGAVIEVDGDVLGRQVVRVAVPAGIAVPSRSVRPLVEQRAAP